MIVNSKVVERTNQRHHPDSRRQHHHSQHGVSAEEASKQKSGDPGPTEAVLAGELRVDGALEVQEGLESLQPLHRGSAGATCGSPCGKSPSEGGWLLFTKGAELFSYVTCSAVCL